MRRRMPTSPTILHVSNHYEERRARTNEAALAMWDRFFCTNLHQQSIPDLPYYGTYRLHNGCCSRTKITGMNLEPQYLQRGAVCT